MRDDPEQLVTALRSALDEWDMVAVPSHRSATRLVHGSPDRIRDAMANLILTEAKTEYLGFDDPLHLSRTGSENGVEVRGSRTMTALAERGVRVRQVMTYAGTQGHDVRAPSVLWEAASQARVVERLPAKACIVDRRFVLIPVSLSILAHGLLIITDPVVIRLLVAAHHALWEVDFPASEADCTPEHLVSVLAMLASGLTDERAAERLGVSSRTYSRRIAELMEALGAESRFEAGVEAARRGWL